MKMRHRIMDLADKLLCTAGILKAASWQKMMREEEKRLYAGRLYRGLPQYGTSWGITPYFPSTRNIPHDASKPYPIPDNSIDCYQSEDVFEHIELAKIPALIDEIHRILKPGGLFRLSVPDYRFDGYRDRSHFDPDGNILFDPGGGGQYADGKVVGGGHVWHPTIEIVKDLFETSSFSTRGRVEFLHYTDADGSHMLAPIDYSLGHIQRVPEHDQRVTEHPRPISIVVDAIKA